MRAITPTERAQIAAGQLAVFVRASIVDGDGVWRDLTALTVPSLPGRTVNLFNGASGDVSLDQPVSTATITLRRDAVMVSAFGTLPALTVPVSLAPTKVASPLNRRADGSYAPLVDVGRRIRVAGAFMAPGAVPADGDWRGLFEGIVDTVDWAAPSAEVPLACRDLGARLLDAQISEERTYGGPVTIGGVLHAGTPLPMVLRQILDDNGYSTVPLITPVDPDWELGAFTQTYGSLLTALRDLAAQRGWDVRYVWRGAAGEYGTFDLVLSEPDRAKTTPDWTLPPSEYRSVDALSVSLADVRNVVRVTYLNSGTGAVTSVENDGAVVGDSVARYGARFMELAEDATSAIDTPEEALRLANAAAHDLAFPAADQSVTDVGFWIAQLGDLGQFPPNDVHYDEAQALAVQAVRWTATPGHFEATLRTRGSVAGAYRSWLTKSGPPSPSGPAAGSVVPVLSAKLRPDLTSEGTVWVQYSMTAPGHTMRLRARINNGAWADRTGLVGRTIDDFVTFPRTTAPQALDLVAVADDGTESNGVSLTLPGTVPLGLPVVSLVVNRYGSLCTTGKRAQLTLTLQFSSPLLNGWRCNATALEAAPYASPTVTVTSDGTLQVVTLALPLSGWGSDTGTAHTYQVNWNVLDSVGASKLSGVASVVGDSLTTTCP